LLPPLVIGVALAAFILSKPNTALRVRGKTSAPLNGLTFKSWRSAKGDDDRGRVLRG
jgi:hypothetical protein